MTTKTTGDFPPPEGSSTENDNVGGDRAEEENNDHAEEEEEESSRNLLEGGDPPADSEESFVPTAAAAAAPASSHSESAPEPHPSTLQTPDGQVHSKVRTASVASSSNRRSTGLDSIDSAATFDSGGAGSGAGAGAGAGGAGAAMASATANGSSQHGSSAPGAYRVAPSDSSLGGARVPPPTVLTRQTVQPHTSLTRRSNGTPDNSTITDSFLVPEAELVVEDDDGATGTTAGNGTRTTGGTTANGTSVGTGADAGEDTTLRSDVIVTAIKEDEMWRACGVTLPRCVWLVLILAGAMVAFAAVLGALAGTGTLGGSGGGSESVAATGSGATDNNSISAGIGGGESAASVAPTLAPTPMPTYQCEWTRFPASKDTELGNDPYNIVAIDGDTAVVGYPQENEGRGLVNILVKRDGRWEMQAILSPSEEGKADDTTGPGAHFGHSVAITGDTVIVGGKWQILYAIQFCSSDVKC